MSENNQAVAVHTDAAIIEAAVIAGDLAKMSPADRVTYYARVCDSLHLNPLTKPFDYITLNGRLVLYATRTATDQLRARDRISVTIVARERIDDVYVVTARATTLDGRTDESVGAVSVAGLKGDALANAYMKSETKSKRRVTLSICGLGFLDETEIETVPTARPAHVDADGVILEQQPGPRVIEPPKVEPKPSNWDRLTDGGKRNSLRREWAKVTDKCYQFGIKYPMVDTETIGIDAWLAVFGPLRSEIAKIEESMP